MPVPGKGDKAKLQLVYKARASHFYAFFTQDHNEDEPSGFHPFSRRGRKTLN